MTTQSYAVRDSMTMLRRNLLHSLRYPSLALSTLLMPIIILLLFVGIFGNALSAGINHTDYINYVAPAILLITATSGSVATAVSVASDMTEGIINRFRTMAISRNAVLTGQVIGSFIQTMLTLVLVIGAALLMGFRPNAGFGDWLAALGILALLTLALTWLAAGMGAGAKTIESASNLPMPFTFLPMLGSGFVPTDSLPGVIRWFAEYQPFTPINETLRGLLMGTPIGNHGIIAVVWCVVIAAGGYAWARRAFHRTAVN
ncbi:ABC transporter permease [Actinocrispum wychmicini]|uniref:Transport permease protein n=1 Tax=Actinocrispum wychmicini TaxID=1213861 RepID=A0A4R2JUQ9_9PSEU|nr:ABC transporter permease [Actinocrispum wychmicini]TCO61058.1 ABC-2 type transport system permease protein [Actinocrispum wychmicini]